jgi:hypothetical protein
MLRAGSRRQASLRKIDAVDVRKNPSSGPAKPGKPLREWIRIHSSRLFSSRSTRPCSCLSFSPYWSNINCLWPWTSVYHAQRVPSHLIAIFRLCLKGLDQSELFALNPFSPAFTDWNTVVSLGKTCASKVSKRAYRISNSERNNVTISGGCCWFDGINEWSE